MLAQTSLNRSQHELEVRGCEYEESQNVASALVDDPRVFHPKLVFNLGPNDPFFPNDPSPFSPSAI